MPESIELTTSLPDIERYYKRLAFTYGADSRACGYSNPIAQLVRFKCYATHMKIKKEASILDVGCGTGDLLYWLSEADLYPSRYLGIDLLQEQIDSAKILYEKRMLNAAHPYSSIEFRRSTVDEVKDRNFDVAVACSIFDVKQRDVATTFKIAQNTLFEMFCCLGEEGVLGADFFSPYALDIQPFNAPIPPEWMLTWAKTNLSERVLVDLSYAPHNYALIVFKGDNDFMRLWKAKGGWDRNRVGESPLGSQRQSED